MDMNMNTKTTASKPAGFTKTDAPQAFREMAEKGTTQTKETYEKMSAATTEAAGLIKDSYATAVKGMQDYNNKFIEFAHANTNAAFDFFQKLSFGILRTFDRTCTQADRDDDRADQATCGACPEGDARDCGATQDGRRKGVQPRHLN
jgi:hypothetical protein